jgi:hypothetical protein
VLTAAQLKPLSLLSQAPPDCVVTGRLDLPAGSVVLTSPAIRIRWPAAAAYVRSRTWPVPAGSFTSARRQLVPVADKKITGPDFAWSPPGTFDPTAMKPEAVRITWLTRSPVRSGIPAEGDNVQVRPSVLVQIESGPTATH